MTEVLSFTGESIDVFNILSAILEKNGEGIVLDDPGEHLDSLAVVVCETMPVAMVKHIEDDRFDVTHLACYQPTHGTHPRMAELAGRLSGLVRADKVPSACPMCGGREWLPVGGEEARSGAAFAVSLGVFRGIELPKTESLEQLRKVAIELAFSSVLDHPVIAHIKNEVGQNIDQGTKK
jgi:hypothetical protein